MKMNDLRYTLCFLTRGDDVLMLHRNNPPNQGLWNGIGGRIETGESVNDSVLREIKEETGFELQSVRFTGLLTWSGFEIPAGGLYIFTAEAPGGEAIANDEGALAWKPREWVFTSAEVVSNIHIFGPLTLNGHPPAEYHFEYQNGVITDFSIHDLPPGWQLLSPSTQGGSMADLSQEEILRYSRHIILPDVGLDGQRKLKQASVLLVGSGGLGSPAALYLAAAGVGHIGIVDYDVVEDSNLQRQVIHDTRVIGRRKVESARQKMVDLNPYVQVDALDVVLSSENAVEISDGFDLLIDGTDNFPTRYLLNDLAVLTRRPYVYGSIFRFEGQVSVFDARIGPCYRCLFPEPPPPGSVPSCAEGGVFGVLPGTVGTIQATEAIKLILGIGEALIGRLLLFDALDMSFQTVRLRKNPGCSICGEQPSIDHLVDYEQFCGVPTRGSYHVQGIDEIEPQEASLRIARGEPIKLLDVRDPVELQVSRLPGAKILPVGQVLLHLDELDRESKWVVFCRSGERSARVVKAMQAAGFQAVNLRGGINAWAEQVDPSLLRY